MKISRNANKPKEREIRKVNGWRDRHARRVKKIKYKSEKEHMEKKWGLRARGQCHAFVSTRTSRRVDASMLHLHVTPVCIRSVPSGEEVESAETGDRETSCVHARLDIRAHFWIPTREWCDVTRRDAKRGEARRRDASVRRRISAARRTR